LLKFFHVATECLTLLTDFAEGMHNPSAELTKVFVESKRGSDAESHSKEGDGFVNDHIAGDEEPICGLYVLLSLMMQAIGLIRKSKERRSVNEDGRAERMGGQAQGFSCR
jgi:hypothetical protein